MVGIPNAHKKDYDIVAVIVPDAAHFAEVHGEDCTDAQIHEELAGAVAEVNELVQPYKRIDLLIRRDAEFEKNTSKKIKRAGVVESVMEEYRKQIGA